MLVTLNQGANITNLSTMTLRRRIKSGKLPAILKGKTYFIEEKDLVPYIKKNSAHNSYAEREVPQGTPFQPERDLITRIGRLLRGSHVPMAYS